LHEAHIAAALALATGLPFGPAEEIQEAAFTEARIGELLGGKVLGEFLQVWLGARRDI